MYELIQAYGNSYYIESPAKIGLVRINESEVCLIDSGSDKDAGRKIRQILDANGWKLRAILNTHSNADHIGGNTLLQNRLNCAVYSTPMENAVIEAPILEPSFLYAAVFSVAGYLSAADVPDKNLSNIVSFISSPGIGPEYQILFLRQLRNRNGKLFDRLKALRSFRDLAAKIVNLRASLYLS